VIDGSKDLEESIISFNLLRDQENLYQAPYVSEDADFDFGCIFFDSSSQYTEN
jgi:hypothetical protein